MKHSWTRSDDPPGVDFCIGCGLFRMFDRVMGTRYGFQPHIVCQTKAGQCSGEFQSQLKLFSNEVQDSIQSEGDAEV